MSTLITLYTYVSLSGIDTLKALAEFTLIGILLDTLAATNGAREIQNSDIFQHPFTFVVHKGYVCNIQYIYISLRDRPCFGSNEMLVFNSGVV